MYFLDWLFHIQKDINWQVRILFCSLFLLEMRTLGKFGSLKRLYTEHLIFQSNIDGKLFNHQYTQEHYEFDEHGEILAP